VNGPAPLPATTASDPPPDEPTRAVAARRLSRRRGRNAAGTGKSARELERRPIIRLLVFGGRLFARLYHRVFVLSPQRLPLTGPAILVCNHISGLDPVLLQSVCPRLVIWMMAKEYYDIKGLGWIFSNIDAIPVERSGRDSAATPARRCEPSPMGKSSASFPKGRSPPHTTCSPSKPAWR